MTTPRSAWFIYITLRLLFFAVPFAALMLLGIWPWLAAVFAGLIGVSLSVIFLARPRAAASESIYDWRNRDRTADDIIEDEAIDGIDGSVVATESSAKDSSEAPNTTVVAKTTEATPLGQSDDTTDSIEPDADRKSTNDRGAHP